MIELIGAVALLAACTAATRAVGVPRRREDEQPRPRRSRAITLATAALLGAVVATATLYAGQDFGGWARVIGVGGGMVAALLRSPLLAVIAIAVGMTALLRLLGVP